MAAPIYIPSSGGSAGQNPESVSVITTSYTVPAGKYAKLVVNLEGSATFTVNGTTALRGTQATVLSSDNLRLTLGGGSSTSNALFTSTADGGASGVGTVFNETTQQETVTTEINLPAGAVANGTGTWRALVMIFSV